PAIYISTAGLGFFVEHSDLARNVHFQFAETALGPNSAYSAQSAMIAVEFKEPSDINVTQTISIGDHEIIIPCQIFRGPVNPGPGHRVGSCISACHSPVLFAQTGM